MDPSEIDYMWTAIMQGERMPTSDTLFPSCLRRTPFSKSARRFQFAKRNTGPRLVRTPPQLPLHRPSVTDEYSDCIRASNWNLYVYFCFICQFPNSRYIPPGLGERPKWELDVLTCFVSAIHAISVVCVDVYKCLFFFDNVIYCMIDSENPYLSTPHIAC